MHNHRPARLLSAALPLLVSSIGLIGAPSTLVADDHEGKPTQCSNQTLEGNYGLTIEGLLAVPGPGLQLRGVVLQHYDGHGNITQVDHAVINGVPPNEAWRQSTGTYSVNPDCSGTATLNLPGGPPLVLYFVMSNHGKKIRQVVDGNAVVATGEQLD